MAAKGNENKEVNDILIICVGGAIAYFGIVRPLMMKLGLTDDPDDETVNNQDTVADIDNPFSFNWGVVNADAGKLNMDVVNATINYIKANAGTNILGFPTGGTISAPYAQLADTINQAFGLIWISDQSVIDAFAQVTCQYEVWQMAVYTVTKYDRYLYDWIKKGNSITGLDNGLKHDQLASIIDRVNQLPIYYTGTSYI